MNLPCMDYAPPGPAVRAEIPKVLVTPVATATGRKTLSKLLVTVPEGAILFAYGTPCLFRPSPEWRKARGPEAAEVYLVPPYARQHKFAVRKAVWEFLKMSPHDLHMQVMKGNGPYRPLPG